MTLGTAWATPLSVLPSSSLVLRAALGLARAPEPAPVEGPRLEWLAPPECPDARRGAELLARFLGERAPSGTARVELAADASGHSASVTVNDATRTLRGSDCETLARAAALVVAVSLDPSVAEDMVLPEEAPPEPASAVPDPIPADPPPEPIASRNAAPSDPAPTPAPTPAPAPTRTSPSRRGPPAGSSAPHWLTLGSGLSGAAIPAITGVIRMGYGYHRGALHLHAHATYATPRVIAYPDSGVGGRFQALSLDARACFAPAVGRFAIPLCGGAESGMVVGRGLGVADAQRPVGAWVGLLASTAVRVQVHPRVAVTMGADFVALLRRPAFIVGEREILFRSPVFGLRGLLGVELRVP